MTIKFEWRENGRRGYMEYDVDVMIKHRQMTDYKNWAKLLVKYGTNETIDSVIARIKMLYQEAFEMLNINLANKNEKETKRTQNIMKMYNRKYEILSRLIQ